MVPPPPKSSARAGTGTKPTGVIDGFGVRLGLGVKEGFGVALGRTVLVGFGVFVGLPCAIAGMTRLGKSNSAMSSVRMKVGRILAIVLLSTNVDFTKFIVFAFYFRANQCRLNRLEADAFSTMIARFIYHRVGLRGSFLAQYDTSRVDLIGNSLNLRSGS